MFHKSQAIIDFFKENKDLDGFWDFVHETDLYDEQWWSGDEDSYDLLHRGFALAKQAGNALVYQVSIDDIEDGASDNSFFYFIGPEKEVIEKLNKKLQEWLQKYPQETEQQKQLSDLKKRREAAEQKLKNAQIDLKVLKEMEKEAQKKK